LVILLTVIKVDIILTGTTNFIGVENMSKCRQRMWKVFSEMESAGC